jgi:flagellin FlaB
MTSEYPTAVERYFETEGWDTSRTRVREDTVVVPATREREGRRERLLVMVVTGPDATVTPKHVQYLVEKAREREVDRAVVTTRGQFVEEASRLAGESGVDVLDPGTVFDTGTNAAGPGSAMVDGHDRQGSSDGAGYGGPPEGPPAEGNGGGRRTSGGAPDGTGPSGRQTEPRGTGPGDGQPHRAGDGRHERGPPPESRGGHGRPDPPSDGPQGAGGQPPGAGGGGPGTGPGGGGPGTGPGGGGPPSGGAPVGAGQLPAGGRGPDQPEPGTRPGAGPGEPEDDLLTTRRAVVFGGLGLAGFVGWQLDVLGLDDGGGTGSSAPEAGSDQWHSEESGEQSVEQVSNRLDPVTKSGRDLGGETVGVAEVVVKRAPGAGDIDLRNVTVQWVGPSGTYSLVHPGVESSGADGRFGVSAVADDDGSLPVLNAPDDRATLVFDLGTDQVDVDDARSGETGPGATFFGEQLPAGAEVSVQVTTQSGGTTEIRLAVPETLSGGDAVQL